MSRVSVYHQIMLELIKSKEGNVTVRLSPATNPHSVARCVSNAKLYFKTQSHRRLARAQIAVTPQGTRYMRFSFTDSAPILEF